MKPRMPRSVKVGPHSYTIIRKVIRKEDGWCDFQNLQILIQKRLKRSRAQVTLVHEILHACNPNPHEAVQEEEALVTGVAPVLLDVLQINPDLVAYLTN